MIKKIASVFFCSALSIMLAPSLQAQAPSQWVYYNSSHQLQYQTDALGNKILDFSYAGYQGGGVALPDPPVRVTVHPSGGDDTANIQNAINQVAQLPPDFRGFRGAVLLAPGAYTLSQTIHLNTSGVVLRGSGSGSDGTVITMTGAPFLGLDISGTGSWQTVGATQPITDSYVPSGANTVTVADASGFTVGETVLIRRPVTAAWIHFMGMDVLRDSKGNLQKWMGTSTIINTDRVIRAIDGNQLTFDAPLTDSFDSQYLTGSVVGYTYPGRISRVGVEHLRMIAPAVNVDISSPQFLGVRMDAVINSWLSDIVWQDTQNTVTVSNTVKQVTMDRVIVDHTVVHTGDRMADFGISGTEIFIDRCASDGTGEWPMVMQSRVTGPIVLLNFFSTQAAGIAPHQRWGTGMLADNAVLPNAPKNPNGGATGIAYQDRGNHGSGQGWAAGWSVAWNVTTPYFVVQQFPGGENWCIGCVGTKISTGANGYTGNVPDGIYDSLGALVTPSSLYLAQLEERKGPAALAAIGYADFGLSATPASQTVSAGGTARYSIDVTPINGFNEDVHLIVTGSRPGVSVGFKPQIISGGSGSTDLTITTSPNSQPGTYTFLVRGNDENLSHSTTVTLTVE